MRFLSVWIGWKTSKYQWRRIILSSFGVAIAFLFISTTFFSADSIHYVLTKEQIEPLANLDLILKPNKSSLMPQSLEEVIKNDTNLIKDLDAISPRFVVRGAVGIQNENGLVTTGISLIGINPEKDVNIGIFQKNEKTINISSLINNNPSNITATTAINVVITDTLANILQLQENQNFTVQFYVLPNQPPFQLVLHTALIIDTVGKAKYYSDSSIFIDLFALQTLSGQKGNITEIALSLSDTARKSKEQQADLISKLKELIKTQKYAVEIINIREEWENRVSEATNSILSFYLALAFSPIVASITLIVIIFYLLIDERRKELATMRAVGMHRREIFFQLSIESLFLLAFGGVIGITGGIFATKLLLSFLHVKPPSGSTFNFVSGVRYGYSYDVVIIPLTLIKVFIFGALLVILPTIIAAWKISHMNIIEGLHHHETTLGTTKASIKVGIGVVIVAVLLMIASFTQIASNSDLAAVLFIIGALSVYISLNYLFPTKKSLSFLWTLVNLAILSQFTRFMAFLIENDVSISEIFPVAFMVHGIIIGCIFVVQILPYLIIGFTKTTSKLSKGAIPIIYALSSLKHNNLRTMLLLVLLSVILSMAFAVTTFSAGRSVAIQNEISRNFTMQTDFIAYLTQPLKNTSTWESQAKLYQIPTYLTLVSDWYSTRTHVSFEKLSKDAEERFRENKYFDVVGIDNSVSEQLNVSFIYIDPQYTETEAWQMVLMGKAALYSYRFYRYLDMPLGTITLEGEHANRSVPVIGYIFANNADIYIDKTLFSELFPNLNGSRNLYFSFTPYAKKIMKTIKNEDEFLSELQSNLTKSLLSWGPFVRSSQLFIKQLRPLIELSFRSVENYMYLGLLIGIAAIGLTTSRRIDRSKFEFGIMISYGATKSEISAAILIEIVFFIITSILIGFTSPLIFFGELMRIYADSPLIIPVTRLLFWITVIITTSMISTALPLYRIVHLQPTKILREIE